MTDRETIETVGDNLSIIDHAILLANPASDYNLATALQVAAILTRFTETSLRRGESGTLIVLRHSRTLTKIRELIAHADALALAPA